MPSTPSSGAPRRAERRRQRMTVSPPTTPLAAVVLGLLLGAAAAAPFWQSGPIVFGLAVVSLLYALMNGPAARVHWTVLAFVAWSGVTFLWAETPSESLRAILTLLTATVAVTFLVGQLTRAQVYRALATALKVLIALSWLLYFGLPGSGREQESYHHGAFTGIFIQRNTGAFVLGAAVLTFLFMATHPELPRRRSSAVWAAVAFAALVAAESGTGLAVTVVSSVVMLVVMRIRLWPSYVRQTLSVLAVLTVAGLLVQLQNVVAFVSGLLGRDDTLTGRTLIWASLRPYLDDRPWLGWGWGSLWTSHSVITRAMWSVAHFEFPHAHNAYLDARMQSGFIGLTLLMLVCAGILLRSGRRLVAGEDGAWPVFPTVMTLFLLLYGIDEQAFMSVIGLLILVTCSALVPSAGSPPRGPRHPRRRRGVGSVRGPVDRVRDRAEEDLPREALLEHRPRPSRRPRQ